MAKAVKNRARQCKKILENGERCKAFAMNNGFCRMHGGLNKRRNDLIRANKNEVNRAKLVRRQIEEVKANLKLRGQTFNNRYKQMSESPDLLNMRNDICSVATLIDLLIEYLDSTEFEGKERLMLVDKIAILTDISSKIKERMFKVKVGYFDAESMKLVVAQVVAALRSVKSKCEESEAKQLNRDQVIKWLNECIIEIGSVKVPLVDA